jgi:hypothetical protein
MRKILVPLAIVIFSGFAMAQTYTEGTGIIGVDKLGAHQNGGRGCVGCHAPHSGARGNGGNAVGGAVTDDETGDLALWGQDLGPLYGQNLAFGAEGAFDITLPSSMSVSGTAEQELTGVVMCLSCHDGNIAKGAMMTNQSYEQARGLLPATYGTQPIPTLLGNDGTAAGNYKNDHPIGPKATLGAVGVASRLVYSVGGCGTAPNTYDCLLPSQTANNGDYWAFYQHYGAFNITTRLAPTYQSGHRAVPVVLPTTSAADAYLVCTTCHTPHSMYTFSGRVKNQSTQGTYPTYFFIAAPYNPGAPITNPGTASSATQFCRQCHFTGAGGSNEGSGIMGVTTQF